MNSFIPSINWSWTQPMQITATTPSPNFSYQSIAKDFIERYATANLNGIGCVGHFYNADTLCSIHLHQGNVHNLSEVMGHSNWMRKLNEIGISIIRYHTINHTNQPVGKNSVLVTFNGQAEINSKNYGVVSVFILKLTNGSPRIINHILDIFM